MKLVHQITLLLFIISMSGCLPDSLTKWESEEETNVLASPATVSIDVDGEQIRVEDSSGGTPPSSMTLTFKTELGSTTLSSSNELRENKAPMAIGKEHSLTPSFPEGTSGTFFYSITKLIDGVEVRFPYSDYGLSFDRETGVLSGSPTTYLPTSDVFFKAYHVESGIWTAVPMNILAVTSFGNEESNDGQKVYYPYFKDYKNYFIIEVEDTSSFKSCPYDATKPPCVTADNGVQGYVEYINEDAKRLFVTVANYSAEDHAVFEDATTLDNSNNFVFNDSGILSVVRLFKRCTELDTTSCDREILPGFNFDLSTDDEKATLEWSITPIPAGGIAPTRGELSSGIGFIEESLGTNSGAIFIPGSAPSLQATPFNISVKNLLGETLTTTVTISVSQAPENLGVGNLYILTLDSNEDFRVGNFISANNSTDARGKVLEKIGIDKLIIELQSGDFEKGNQVDHLKAFSRKRGIIQYKTLFNSILTVQADSGITLPNEDAPEENEYKNKISQTLETITNTAVIKGINQNLISLSVYGGAHQFSPGLQIVQAGEGLECNNGDGVSTTGAVGTVSSIQRNPYEGDRDESVDLIVNTLSGTFVANRPVQLGGSEYDCTTTSVDLIKSVSTSIQPQQVYAMVPNGFNFSIINPNEIKDSTDHSLKINEATIGTLPLFSIWSQNIKFHSINEAGTWSKGDYISTRSHIPGVINHVEEFTEPGVSDLGGGTPGTDEEGQIVTAHFNQIGFLFSSLDSCDDGGDSNLDYPEREACRQNSDDIQERNPGRGDEGDEDPEIIFAKGSTYKFENIMNMSAYDVSIIGLEDNGDKDGTPGDETEDLRDDPQIKNLSTTHHYVFYVREPLVLKAELQYGDETFFEISPEEIPPGLEFDSTNGTLSGVPSQKLNRSSFIITAKNPIGEASAEFTIEIKDHFKIAIPKNFTEPESFKLHMSGQGNQATDCRITADQIEGANQDVKDILCHLEAGEMDLYFLGLELQYNIGPSMCEFVSFEPYSTYNTLYPYIKTGTVGAKNGSEYDLPVTSFTPNTNNNLSEELTNVENGVKVSRVYEYDESCIKCMHPETGDIIDCTSLPENPAGGNHCESDYTNESFGKNCDDGSFKIKRIIIGKDDQEIPNSAGEIVTLKDGICGYVAFGSNNGVNTPLTYESFEFKYAVIDKNSDGKANASDDFGTGSFASITGNASAWNSVPAIERPCSVGSENPIQYDVDTSNNPLEISFVLVDDVDNIHGTACSADDVEGNSIGDRVTYPLIRVVGSFPSTTLRDLSDTRADSSKFNNMVADYTYWFVDTNSDDIPDSIVFDLASNDNPDWDTLKTCAQCKDLDGDGKIDFVDFNGDGAADDIDGAGAVGDGFGDHTFGSRLDSTGSEVEDEDIQFCGGNPRLCLDGSVELITSHSFDDESAIRGFELNSVYGIESETFTFEAPAKRFNDNSKLANYSAENSCGLNPRIIHQSSVFHDTDSNGSYDDAEALKSTDVQLNAGDALYLDAGIDTFTVDTGLFFELFASYSDENFYKGLGDLLYDDLIHFDDEGDTNGDTALNELDFIASVALPYVYKETFDTAVAADTKMGASPTLGIANDGAKYQLVSVQKDYDTSITKSEMTYFDNGFKNLANLARKEIIRLPVSFNHTENLRGVRVYSPAPNTEQGIVINQGASTVDILLTRGVKSNILDTHQWTSTTGSDSPTVMVNVFQVNLSTKGFMTIPFAQYNFGSSTYKTKPYYTFNCLDAARDLKARIRVEVRDWDRVFTAGHDIDKAIPSSLMEDSSIDLWDEDFNNRTDGDDYGARTLNSCLINYPTNFTPTGYDSLPSPP